MLVCTNCVLKQIHDAKKKAGHSAIRTQDFSLHSCLVLLQTERSGKRWAARNPIIDTIKRQARLLSGVGSESLTTRPNALGVRLMTFWLTRRDIYTGIHLATGTPPSHVHKNISERLITVIFSREGADEITLSASQ